jgi:hypothetical protein
MAELLRSRITLIWLLLIGATILSWESVRAAGRGGGDYTWSTVTVMVVAFIKVRFVGLEFMELRSAPLILRAMFEIWLVVVCVAILVIRQIGLQ